MQIIAHVTFLKVMLLSTKSGSVAGPVIQANGRLIFEDDLKGQEVCYASLHSEPASALGLPTVWSLWGNPGIARC